MFKSKNPQVRKKCYSWWLTPWHAWLTLLTRLVGKVKCKPETAFQALPGESLWQQATSRRNADCQFSVLSPDTASLTLPFINLERCRTRSSEQLLPAAHLPAALSSFQSSWKATVCVTPVGFWSPRIVICNSERPCSFRCLHRSLVTRGGVRFAQIPLQNLQ